ncbi:unnamed protein product [Rhizoctonia solani]|uniref:Ricin B lectin domain-containing protein n=1 Tax=Rhizoctonia solani TaxID=456999 RepID=A0A8H3HBE7_9AGAM|nr:unnamed protein product [Rhizoctonia solani]
MIKWSLRHFLWLVSLPVIFQPTMVLGELLDGVYLISQKPLAQLKNNTYYLALSGVNEKTQLRKLVKGSDTQKWEITNVPEGITLKNIGSNCHAYVGSLSTVLPIGAPLFCSLAGTSSPEVFQSDQNADGSYQIKRFNWRDPSLFYLMHTVPLNISLEFPDVYGNISFVPFATSFATNFRFERLSGA